MLFPIITGERCFEIEIDDDVLVEPALECFGVTITLPEAERENIMLTDGSDTRCIQDDDSQYMFVSLLYYL